MQWILGRLNYATSIQNIVSKIKFPDFDMKNRMNDIIYTEKLEQVKEHVCFGRMFIKKGK